MGSHKRANRDLKLRKICCEERKQLSRCKFVVFCHGMIDETVMARVKEA